MSKLFRFVLKNIGRGSTSGRLFVCLQFSSRLPNELSSQLSSSKKLFPLDAIPVVFMGCVKPRVTGRVGSGEVDATRPDPWQFKYLLTRPDPTRPDP